MRRLPVTLVLLFAMLWQSVALARPGSTVNVLADLQHAVLHLQEEAHHHHDDGSYHLDDSKESAQHLLCDYVSANLATLAAALPLFLPLGSTAPVGVGHQAAPEPAPEGLLRPPRSRA